MTTETAKNALIAISTRINLMRGSETFAEVHNDFRDALKVIPADAGLTPAAEAEAFHEVLRRRGLIQTIKAA